jgi:hypothetical protein
MSRTGAPQRARGTNDEFSTFVVRFDYVSFELLEFGKLNPADEALKLLLAVVFGKWKVTHLFFFFLVGFFFLFINSSTAISRSSNSRPGKSLEPNIVSIRCPSSDCMRLRATELGVVFPVRVHVVVVALEFGKDKTALFGGTEEFVPTSKEHNALVPVQVVPDGVPFVFQGDVLVPSVHK